MRSNTRALIIRQYLTYVRSDERNIFVIARTVAWAWGNKLNAVTSWRARRDKGKRIEQKKNYDDPPVASSSSSGDGLRWSKNGCQSGNGQADGTDALFMPEQRVKLTTIYGGDFGGSVKCLWGDNVSGGGTSSHRQSLTFENTHNTRATG